MPFRVSPLSLGNIGDLKTVNISWVDRSDPSRDSSRRNFPVSSSHTCRLVNSLGTTFLDPVVRVFFLRSFHTLRLCLRSRGLVGIGSGVGWVSGMAGRRRVVLCS